MEKAQPDKNCFYQGERMKQEEITKLLDSLSTQIESWLCQFNIKSNYTHEDIKNDVFLLVQKLIAFGKLESYLEVDVGLSLVRVKGNLREPIINQRAWLRTVAFNYVRGLHRKHKRFLHISPERWESLLSTEHSNVVLFTGHTHPIQYIENWELRDNIKKLPDEDSKILEFFYFNKLSYAEISIHLESKGYPRYTKENIRQKKLRALKKLRRIYL
ncbi:MAG: sigma-70 family RNA polymerase sigma factor [Moorea sp. SIO4A3]|nr:sigma-70 family RNA polymerase sigma factor [Moorena sp. SIO4A3]